MTASSAIRRTAPALIDRARVLAAQSLVDGAETIRRDATGLEPLTARDGQQALDRRHVTERAATR